MFIPDPKFRQAQEEVVSTLIDSSMMCIHYFVIEESASCSSDALDFYINGIIDSFCVNIYQLFNGLNLLDPLLFIEFLEKIGSESFIKGVISLSKVYESPNHFFVPSSHTDSFKSSICAVLF